MSNQEECDCPPEGLPQYMGTFADLMALLMCFFVLLLSFSEMDVLKFKQIAGSMQFAFGVQNKVDVKDIPKGTSIIAQEFSPGKPKPTVIEAIMQQTIDVTKETLEFDEPDEDDPDEGEGEQSNKGEGDQSDQGTGEQLSSETEEERAARLAKAQAEAEALAQSIASELQREIIDGQVELLAKGAYVVIRIREKGSFASASDTIEEQFVPVLNKIETILSETEGEIRVAGHTDNLPINNEYFRSNWELSGARAGSVTRELLKSGLLEKTRFVITGYADTKPIADNQTSEGRATNRRVEIIIVKGEQPEGEVVGVGLESPTGE
ncbi:flagellar motor protein MotB [Aliikangiella coralliicola]|uniref:OmpA family protein n=1 Tax=Aliikangiella coralliicola TaxID=2592383 RepID=A0A545U7X4_9GAMM|nr:flagellar motor protein MotB [Aliikangiella coralliicola]TQV85567.1 OmpA family protein [Aliikangiella coralliicola]